MNAALLEYIDAELAAYMGGGTSEGDDACL